MSATSTGRWVCGTSTITAAHIAEGGGGVALSPVVAQQCGVHRGGRVLVGSCGGVGGNSVGTAQLVVADIVVAQIVGSTVAGTPEGTEEPFE